MSGYDHYIQRAQTKAARDQRLAKVRALIAELARDEKEELLVELLAELNPGDVPKGERPPSTSPREPVTTDGNGRSVHATKPDGYTVAQAVLDAASDGKARPAGDLIRATKAVHPWVNEKSIPAAIARLAGDEPPRLVRRGKTNLGHPKYVIAPQPEAAP